MHSAHWRWAGHGILVDRAIRKRLVVPPVHSVSSRRAWAGVGTSKCAHTGGSVDTLEQRPPMSAAKEAAASNH